MNKRQLSWTRKYNNNTFIIASRAYFQHGYPLIQDSLSNPWTRLQWWWVRRADCLRHCKAGSFSESTIEDFEHKNHVRLSKTNSTYHRTEYNISTNLICWQHDITPWSSHYSNCFSQPATAHIARRFSWHVLSKQRSCYWGSFQKLKKFLRITKINLWSN